MLKYQWKTTKSADFKWTDGLYLWGHGYNMENKYKLFNKGILNVIFQSALASIGKRLAGSGSCSMGQFALLCGRREWHELRHNWKILISMMSKSDYYEWCTTKLMLGIMSVADVLMYCSCMSPASSQSRIPLYSYRWVNARKTLLQCAWNDPLIWPKSDCLEEIYSWSETHRCRNVSFCY